MRARNLARRELLPRLAAFEDFDGPHKKKAPRGEVTRGKDWRAGLGGDESAPNCCTQELFPNEKGGPKAALTPSPASGSRRRGASRL